MSIEDMPRPWLLAALTGLSMADLVECHARKRRERRPPDRRSGPQSSQRQVVVELRRTTPSEALLRPH